MFVYFWKIVISSLIVCTHQLTFACLSGGGPNNFQQADQTSHSGGGGLDFSTSGIVYEFLGAVGLLPYHGGLLPPLTPSDLDCEFQLNHRCCWENTNGRSDELDWLTVVTRPNATKANKVFQTNDIPDAPFLVVASNKTNSLDQALFVSCPIPCQKRPGKLTFNHWKDATSYIDVCTLPIGTRSYSHCNQVTAANPGPTTVEIPPDDNPFQIVIVASEFTGTPGGIVAIDNIKYTDDGDSCYRTTTASTTTAASKT